MTHLKYRVEIDLQGKIDYDKIKGKLDKTIRGIVKSKGGEMNESIP